MARYCGFSVRITGSRPTSPSGLCSLRRSETSSQWFRPQRARKLSWACSSSGVDRSAAHPAFHAKQLPWASRWRLPNRNPAGSLRRALRSIRPRRLAQSLSRSTAPLEVSHLVMPLNSARASPTRAHGFTSGSEPRYRALASPLWVVARQDLSRAEATAEVGAAGLASERQETCRRAPRPALST